MKIIAFIAAILSAATVATLAFTTVPSIQNQAADNAEAIAYNSTYLQTLDAAVENLQDGFDTLDGRVDLLQDKILYIHDISLRVASSPISLRIESYDIATDMTVENIYTYIYTYYGDYSGDDIKGLPINGAYTGTVPAFLLGVHNNKFFIFCGKESSPFYESHSVDKTNTYILSYTIKQI